MKNWNYIEGAKIGNSGAHLDSAGARQVRELAAKYWHSGIHDTRNLAMTVAWEWAKRSGVARETTQDLVSEIQDVIDRWLKEIKTGNAKACNADVVKDGDVWVVLYAEGTKSKEFDSEAEAKRFAAQVGNKMVKYTSKADSKKEFLYDEETGDLEVWYDGKKVDSLKKAGEGWKKYIETHATKTGNAEPFDEFIKKLAKEKPELYQSLWNAGKMEALKSYYHKITGNDTPAEYFSKKPKVIGNEKTGVEGFFKQLSDDVKEREKKDDKEIEKVGNGPDPKEAQRLVNLHNYQSLKDIAEDNIKRYSPGHPEYERLKRLISKYEEEIKKNSKVGNSIGGGVQSETVLTEAKDGSQYWVEKTSKSGQYAQYNLYYTIGQGKRHAGVFKDKEAAADAGRRIIGNKIQVRPGFTKEEEFFIRYPGANSREHLLKLIELAKKEGLSKEFIEDMEHDLKSWKVKNSSSNEEYWKKQYIEAARKKGVPEREIQEFIKKIEKEGAKGVLIPVKNVASEYEILKQDPSKMHPLYKKAYEEAMKKLAREDEEFKKRFEKEYGVKAKNEASDDKFAYVMREFDEGKLKTPDGKVVTDPAQAKAIAYSESKKTENGLARARNAIKKS